MSSNFEQYLRSRQISARTIVTYERLLKVFQEWLEKGGRESEGVAYMDLLEYLKERRKKGDSPHYLSQQMTTIRHYYSYLKHMGKIEHNPAAGLYVRDRKRTVPHDLLTTEQLEELYQSMVGESSIEKRKRIMLGLMVYQAVAIAELRVLEVLHIKLRQGKIEIPGTRRSEGRVLKLEAHQMIDLQEHITENKLKGRLFEDLVKPQNSLTELQKELRKKHNYFLSAQQLRQSRIAIWIKQYDIRKVQYMSGHKYVSSTERYQSTDLDDLQKELEKHHPGGG